MVKQLYFLLILAASVTAARAQESDDRSDKLPKAPAGWQYITGKDGSYQFLFPDKPKSSGTRNQSSSRRGLSSKGQINYCELADGTALAISAEKLSGPALKSLKISEVYNVMIDGLKEKGYDLSEPKDFLLGNQKGREYLLTKEQVVQRMVMVILRDGRVFQLTVAAGDKDKVKSPTADTFLKSLVLVTKAPPSKGGKPGDKSSPSTPVKTSDSSSAGAQAKSGTGSAGATSLPVWKPEAKLLEELGPATPVGSYQVRPPKGYTFSPPPPGAPSIVKGFAWAGALRDNQTAPQFMIGLVSAPSTETNKMTLEQYLEGRLRALKGQRKDWTQTTPERGQSNGLTFLRAYWTGTRPDKQWKMHGFMYVCKDGSTFIQLMSQDVEPHHEAALKLAEAAALTFKQK